MEITKEGDEMVVRLPLRQETFDCVGELVGETDNLVGVIDGDIYTISQMIDMTYKNKAPQEGMPFVMLPNREEFERVCKDFNLQIWELPNCAYCSKSIRGSFTLSDKGNKCGNCEFEEAVLKS